MVNESIKGNIAVLGYPKSGNTWLTRLIARSLNVKVSKYILSDAENPEIAADLNNELEINQTNYEISKFHMYPNEFQKKINDTKYIVYIKRDPKSVFISAFFYFKYQSDKKYVKKNISFKSITKIIKWIHGRYLITKFLNEFLTRGLDPFGRWDEHVSQWRMFSAYSNIKIYEVDYNDLLDNTNKKLQELFDFFQIDYKPSNIDMAINKESFNRRKIEILNSDNNQLTFGRKFNERFLRNGKSDDWENYLNKKQEIKIDKLNYTHDL